MPSEEENFDLSGPGHLDNVNWNDKGHQIAIYASLVQGVYTLQRNNKRRRTLDSRWWELFGFKLIDKLYDKDDKSIFGVVYAIGSQCVIAFRGTMKGRELLHDMKLNVSILKNKLDCKSRFETAMKVVNEKVVEFGRDNVILVGHSLGAAIAMLAGKHMVLEKGIFLETFLFNPPHTTAIMLLSENNCRILKKVIRRTMTFLNVTGTVLAFTEEEEKEEEERFAKLSDWKPTLCVHKEDPICSEYQSYFNDMKKMVENGMENIAYTAARVSAIHFWRKVLGMKSDIPLQLLPSAKLIMINRAKGFLDAHKLDQWWKPDLQFHSQDYSIFDH